MIIKRTMKKFIMLFFLILSMTTMCFSQNISNGITKDSIVLITPKQLKETNLIFVEHQKLLKENDILFKQISNYKLDNELLYKTDSLKTVQLENYKMLTESYNLKIEQLNKEITKKSNMLSVYKIGGITISLGLLIWLLLK